MKELDKSKVYDLSELTSEELNEVWKYLTKIDEDWYTCPLEEVLSQSKTDRLLFNKHNWEWNNTIKLEEAINAKELFEDEVTMIAESPKEVFNPQQHYFNELKQFRSLFELSHILELNDWEFDILKRLVRCRKKGQFAQDIQKIKDTADIYLNEFKY